MAWLIEQGFLSPYRIFTAPHQINLDGLRTRMGDYIPGELQERIDKPSITGDAIQHYRKHAAGLRAVVFCVSITHSLHVAAEFNAAGIVARHIDGSTDDAERDQAIIEFADGEVMVLTQVNLVSEGFDLGSIAQADVTIDCVIDLAPTQSLVSYMQRAGRMLRPAPGKVAVLLDHASNVQRHGFPDDVREWSLEGRKKTKRSAKDKDVEDVKISTCERCFAIHKPAPVCPACGHVYELHERKIEQVDGSLVEVTPEQMEAARRQKRLMQGTAQTVEDLMRQGMGRGQATKILEAREAKAAIRMEIMGKLNAHRAATGESSHTAFGVTTSDILRMKPKELKNLLGKLK
jgi:superfamily II DNA or RNA helicase